jgi:hypothetical protein
MKRQLTLAAIACAAAAIAGGTALAQQSGKDMTYTGCVMQGKKAGTYMLTHVMAGKPGSKNRTDAKAPKMLELASASIPLSAESGHEVMVMGTTMKDKTHMKMMVEALESLNGHCGA